MTDCVVRWRLEDACTGRPTEMHSNRDKIPASKSSTSRMARRAARLREVRACPRAKTGRGVCGRQKGLDCLGEFLRGAFPHRCRRVISSDALPETTVRTKRTPRGGGPARSCMELWELWELDLPLTLSAPPPPQTPFRPDRRSCYLPTSYLSTPEKDNYDSSLENMPR